MIRSNNDGRSGTKQELHIMMITCGEGEGKHVPAVSNSRVSAFFFSRQFVCRSFLGRWGQKHFQ